MVVGTTDKDPVFHPFRFAICKGEKCVGFQFIFQASHEADVEWKPSVLCADAWDAIRAGFRCVFAKPVVRVSATSTCCKMWENI